MPEAIPTLRTGTEPVSEWDAGVPAKPIPIPTNMYPRPTCQYGLVSPQRSSIVRNPSRTKTYPVSMVRRDPCDSTSFAERGATSTMHTAAGKIASPASRLS